MRNRPRATLSSPDDHTTSAAALGCSGGCCLRRCSTSSSAARATSCTTTIARAAAAARRRSQAWCRACGRRSGRRRPSPRATIVAPAAAPTTTPLPLPPRRSLADASDTIPTVAADATVGAARVAGTACARGGIGASRARETIFIPCAMCACSLSSRSVSVECVCSQTSSLSCTTQRALYERSHSVAARDEPRAPRSRGAALSSRGSRDRAARRGRRKHTQSPQ